METHLVRDCSATEIPAGNATTLTEGTEVFITQTLGGNVTVRVGQGLFRIANFDIDALAEVDLGESSSATGEGEEEYSDDLVWQAMKQCFDPEIPVNIVDLGLIYDLHSEPENSAKRNVFIKMTLTAQGCGMGPVIAQDARTRIEQLDCVESADVQIVWDPVWNPQMISAEGRQVLGLE